MFGFIMSSLVFAPMIVDCAALDPKYLVEWNARRVFLAQNPTCVEALLAERCRKCKDLILLQAFNDLGAGRDSHILPECAGRLPISTNENSQRRHQKTVPFAASRNKSTPRDKPKDDMNWRLARAGGSLTARNMIRISPS
jgi:hypothetical protein